MRFRNTLISSAVAAALGTGAPLGVLAQSAPQGGQTQSPANYAPLEEVVVTGIKASLESAQQLKKNSDTIQDSIVAEDIGKLPDVTAAEALQRITGIQIGRDLGEGGGTVSIGGAAVNSGIEIRGLPQVETTLNGREVFTATGSRVLNFEDVPSNLLAGIDVYKDPTADLLSSGIGGTVDLRTRRPFDFKGLELEASAAERYADLSGRTKPEFTALASDRWNTGVGEIGGLLAFSYQDRAYRADEASQNGPNTSTAVVPGQTVLVPNGTFNTLVDGERKRIGLDGVLQWQAADDLLVTGEVSSQELDSSQDQFTFYSVGSFNGVNPANLVPGSVTLFPGTLDGSSASYTNGLVEAFEAYRDVTDVTRQFALNSKWTPGNLTLSGDVSYTRASENLTNPTVSPTVTVPTLTQTLTRAGLPVTTVSGVDLSNLASYTSAGYSDSQNHYTGDEKAYRFDVAYDLGDFFIDSVGGGLRYADRTLDFVAVRTSGASISAATLQANSQLFGPWPFGNFYSATQSSPIQPLLPAVNMWQLQHNLAGVEQELGVAGKTAISPGGAFNAQEKNDAVYLRANFKADTAIPIDGNLGVRAVRNADFLNGFAPQYTGKVVTAFLPHYNSNSGTDVLPSLNMRFKWTDSLQSRLSATKVVTYPDFSQLAPSYNILAASQNATAGNPYLRPTKASQVDGTLEWYFSSSSSVYGAVFYKKVKDFVFNNVVPGVVIDGITYNLTEPLNSGTGSIRGLEVGYQQFFDFLPGLWSGLGVQANYTYVDAIAPTSVAGVTTTLPGLSKNSYNLIGMYEKGPISARVAYNWRSQFYQTVYSGATAALAANPIFVHQYGWLDASVTYDFTNQWSVYAQGDNLLRTRLRTFYGVETVPNGNEIDDRQYLVGFRFKFH